MNKAQAPENFADLPALAQHLREDLDKKKIILLFAHNGTGKTRLSMTFNDHGRNGDQRDTLYFNAFTEDLFFWENDLDGNVDRHLRLNTASRFFAGLAEFEMETRIRPLLNRYADFDFSLDTTSWVVRFSRSVNETSHDNIKISRGEENLFIWCFFLVIAELAMDGNGAYKWVSYIYIDDPISSLDEQNAIAVANHLAQRLKSDDHTMKAVISTHHALFFNVLCNEFKTKSTRKYVLSRTRNFSGYHLHPETGDTPFFHHILALLEIHQAAQEDRLFTYHFNMLRVILEKTAIFHGYKEFGDCLPATEDDPDGRLRARLLNVLNHGNYSMFEPRVMMNENKQHFRRILDDFIKHYGFNQGLFKLDSNKGE